MSKQTVAEVVAKFEMPEAVKQRLNARATENSLNSSANDSANNCLSHNVRLENKVCPTCSGVGHFQQDLPIADPNFGRLAPCPDCNVPKQIAQIQSRLEQASGLLDYERGLTLRDFYVRGDSSLQVLEALRQMLAEPYGMLTLWGRPGNGKTLALHILTNEFLARGQTAMYMRLADLFDYLREGYDDAAKENAERRYQQVMQCKFLALDEVDKPRLTPWAEEMLFKLMDDRYRWGRATGTEQRHTALALNKEPLTALPNYVYSRLSWGQSDPHGFRVIHNTDADGREAGL